MKKQLLCFIILAIFGSAYAQVPSYVPSNGLVGWWPFNGNANDESGKGNNGTIDGASLTSDKSGNPNKALSFDGINDFVNIPNNSTLNSNSISISLWTKLMAYNNNSFSFILGKGDDQTAGHFDINIPASNKKSRFVIGPNNYNESKSTINLNEWVNITVTFSSLTSKIYINGNLDTILQHSNNNAFGTNTQDLTIGRLLNPTYPYWYNGIIDDIGIWNRVLSAKEIKNLFLNCSKSITQQPVNQGMYAGNATFSCATDDTLVSYQWQINAGTGWNTLNDAGQVAGSTTKSLNINNVTSFNNNQKFRCIIKGNCLTDTTQEATLRVWGLGINGVNLPEFKLYPNPSSNAVTIAYTQNPYSIAVYNSLGQMVLNQNALTNEHTFDISQWPKGVYYVELIDAATQTNKVQKLIRN